MSELSLVQNLSGIFEKCDLREGMTGAGIAKLLDIPVDDAPETEAGDANDSHADTPSERWFELEPLGEALPPVPAFDADLLPESLRPLVEDVAERMQTPIDFPAVVAVAALAGLTNRRALIQPKANDTSWVVVPNLWGGIVAPPGLMKSPVIAYMTSPARAIEADWIAENDAAMKEHEAAMERHKLDCAVWAENYKKEAKKALGRKTEKPECSSVEPAQKRLITSDATFESLHKLLAENPTGLFVLRDELTGWLAGLERQGREGERAFYLECWNGDAAATLDRIGRGSIHVEHACISLFGGIQPARLRSYLADALRDGPSNDGLIQRFQLLVWPDTDASWKYIDRTPNLAAQRRVESVYRRLAAMDAETPLRLKFDDAAQQMFIAWLKNLEDKIRAEDLPPALQAHFSKYRKLMPALALLFSLADACLESVSLRHAQLAAAWCDYLEQHARRIYASKITPEMAAAQTLAKRLAKGWKRSDGDFTLRDAYRKGWSGLTTPNEARTALRVLCEYGWVRQAQAKDAMGRPSEIYEINPHIPEMK